MRYVSLYVLCGNVYVHTTHRLHGIYPIRLTQLDALYVIGLDYSNSNRVFGCVRLDSAGRVVGMPNDGPWSSNLVSC